MSQRLQVLMDEEELQEIKDIARRRRMTVAEWVRQTLRAACRLEPRTATRVKLEAVHEASSHSFPTADIGELLADIEQGYDAPSSA